MFRASHFALERFFFFFFRRNSLEGKQLAMTIREWEISDLRHKIFGYFGVGFLSAQETRKRKRREQLSTINVPRSIFARCVHSYFLHSLHSFFSQFTHGFAFDARKLIISLICTYRNCLILIILMMISNTRSRSVFFLSTHIRFLR